MKLQLLIVCLFMGLDLCASDHDVNQKNLKNALEYAMQLPRRSQKLVVNIFDATDDSRFYCTDTDNVSKNVLQSMDTEKFKGCVVNDDLVWRLKEKELQRSVIDMHSMHELGRDFDYLIFIIPERNKMSDVFFAESIKQIRGYDKPLVVNVDRNVTEERLNIIGEYIPRKHWIYFGKKTESQNLNSQKLEESVGYGYGTTILIFGGVAAFMSFLCYLRWMNK